VTLSAHLDEEGIEIDVENPGRHGIRALGSALLWVR
jgi:hypothetical protein